MVNEGVPYLAYLLRLWPVETGGRVLWRASLQCVGSGERHGFENLDALFAYVQARTVAGHVSSSAPGGGQSQ